MNNQHIVKFKSDAGVDIQISAEDVRRVICENASDKEVAMFLELCRAQRLNPFIKDAYLVKYGNSPASIITSKEVFTKRANANKAYRGFEAGVVYLAKNGEVRQREGSAVYKAAGEKLVGGWCRVHVEGRKPFYDEVTLEEYSTGKSNWAKMPATMIRKVALVHCLREAFPDDFQGLYAAEEMGKAGEVVQQPAQQPAPVAQVQAAPVQPVEVQEAAEVLDAEFHEIASPNQIEVIDRLAVQLASLRGIETADVYGYLYESKTMQGLGAVQGEPWSVEQADAAASLLGHWIGKAQSC